MSRRPDIVLTSVVGPLPDVQPEPLPPLVPDQVGFIVFGLGRGEQLTELLKHKPPDVPVLVLDSRPDLAQACFQRYDYRALLQDPNVCFLIDQPEVLAQKLHAYLTRRKDLLGVQWIENPWRARLAAETGDLFYHNVFLVYRNYASQAPAEPGAQLLNLYQRLGIAAQEAYSRYPFSCPSGCADCCRQGNGFDLLVRPVEWTHLYAGLKALPDPDQSRLLRAVVSYLATHSEVLAQSLRFFDQHLDQMKTEAVNRDYFRLTQAVRQDPCPFLSAAGNCSVYEHRPMTCRIYGNSYYPPAKPYTCDKDKDLMERILYEERRNHRLIPSDVPMQELQGIHSHYPYGHVMYVWLFTHLDLEQGRFVDLPRLDFQQFQRLAEQPQLLTERLQALHRLADSLA